MKKLTAVQKRNRARWVKGLRSGKYKQGIGWLRCERIDGTTDYCCLGVAEDLGLARGAAGNTCLKATDASAALGLSDGWGSLAPQDHTRLASCNDSGDWSFDEIADLIEYDTWSRS